MKASEYFKKHGLVESKKHLEWMVRVGVRQDIHGWFTDDLKRLVEAHEIIGLFKSLDHAKAEAKACEKAGHSEVLVKLNVGVGYISLSRVKQAIADVEACKEVL